MTSPLVSIIIRTYPSRERFLQQALKSINSQTYSNLEVILVEDGGDTVSALAESYSELSKHKIHYISAHKCGKVKVGNIGLAASSGDFIGFLDDDDILFPDHVTVLVNSLQQNAGCTACYGQSHKFELDSPITQPLNDQIKKKAFGKDRFSKLALMYKNYLPIQSVLFRKSAYLEYGGFDETLDDLEDWDLWLRYCMVQPFLAVPQITSAFRVPETQDARNTRMQNHMSSLQCIRNKQKTYTMMVTGEDILEEHVPLARQKFSGGRILSWINKLMNYRTFKSNDKY